MNTSSPFQRGPFKQNPAPKTASSRQNQKNVLRRPEKITKAKVAARQRLHLDIIRTTATAAGATGSSQHHNPGPHLHHQQVSSMSLSLPASITSLPPATRIVTALLVISTTLLFLLRLSLAPRDLKTIFGASGDTTLAVPWLVLVPGSVVWYPWTLVTAAFAESNLVEVSRCFRVCGGDVDLEVVSGVCASFGVGFLGVSDGLRWEQL